MSPARECQIWKGASVEVLFMIVVVGVVDQIGRSTPQERLVEQKRFREEKQTLIIGNKRGKPANKRGKPTERMITRLFTVENFQHRTTQKSQMQIC